MAETAPIFGSERYSATKHEKITEADRALAELYHKLSDPTYLPSRAEVEAAFFSGDLTRDSVAFRTFVVESDQSGRPVHEILTQEYIERLADYLRSRAEQYRSSPEKPVIVSEVDAGDGRLSYFLGRALAKDPENPIQIIAIDTGNYAQVPIKIEIADCESALKKHKPDIVICSWMSRDIDETEKFRKTDSVKEYLLIGETEGGSVGDDEKTWGSRFDTQSGEYYRVKPWEDDDFERFDLNELSSYQLCRTDAPGLPNHSATVSFRRNTEKTRDQGTGTNPSDTLEV